MRQSDSAVRLKHAEDLAYEGRLQESQKAFISALSVETNKSYRLSILMELARCYSRQQKYDEVIAACNQALDTCDALYGKEDNLKTSILYMIARAQTELGLYEQAKNTCAIASAHSGHFEDRKPSRIFLYKFELADIDRRAGNFTEAIRNYRLIPNLIHRQDLNRFALVACYAAVGQNLEAEKILKSMILSDDFSTLSGGDLVWDSYEQLLLKQEKIVQAKQVAIERNRWAARYALYSHWFFTVTAEGSRLRLLRKYLEQDMLKLKESANL